MKRSQRRFSPILAQEIRLTGPWGAMGEAYAASAAVRARTTEVFMMISLSVEGLDLDERTRLIRRCIRVVGCCDVEDEMMMTI